MMKYTWHTVTKFSLSYFSPCFQKQSLIGWYLALPGLYVAPPEVSVADSNFTSFLLLKNGCGFGFSAFCSLVLGFDVSSFASSVSIFSFSSTFGGFIGLVDSALAAVLNADLAGLVDSDLALNSVFNGDVFGAVAFAFPFAFGDFFFAGLFLAGVFFGDSVFLGVLFSCFGDKISFFTFAFVDLRFVGGDL